MWMLYALRMNMIPNDLLRAASDAREHLAVSARSAAGANVHAGSLGLPMQGMMANAARASIFADALLQAAHARLEELKTVSKS
jgi:hypothetical protein